MAWKAKLISTNLDYTKTLSGIDVEVEFFHSDGQRVSRRTYKWWADDLIGVTLADLRAVIELELNRLNKVETVKETLEPYIGQEIA